MARLHPFDWEGTATTLTPLLPRVKAHIRSAGISPTDANTIASRALEIAIQASRDPTARWILSPHVGAASETAWTGSGRKCPSFGARRSGLSRRARAAFRG